MTIKLPSGKEIDPSFDIIGLSDELEVYQGYDHCLFDHNVTFSNSDKRFIAYLMIKRWQSYLDKINPDYGVCPGPPYEGTTYYSFDPPLTLTRDEAGSKLLQDVLTSGGVGYGSVTTTTNGTDVHIRFNAAREPLK